MEQAIRIGGRDVSLDGIDWIELHSPENAEVQFRDGTMEQFRGADAAVLARTLQRKHLRPASRAARREAPKQTSVKVAYAGS